MDTSLTLLQTIKQRGNDDSWALMETIYAPMIRKWIQRAGIAKADEDDLAQEIFVQVIAKVRTFEHSERTGAFRSWLKQIAINCFRNYIRRRGNKALAAGGSDIREFLEQYADPESDLSRIWDREHESAVMKHLLKVVQPGFSSNTWQAFVETAVNTRSADQVANELGMSIGAVHTAKSRVLAELRRRGAGMLTDFPGSQEVD